MRWKYQTCEGNWTVSSEKAVLAHHRLKVCPEPQSTVIYFLVVGKHVCKCNNGVSFLLRHAYWLDECLKRASNISARNLTGVCARFCASLGGLEYFVLTRAKHLSMTGRRLLNTEGGRAQPGAQRISLCRVKHDSTRPGEGEGFWRVIVAVDWTSLWTFTRDTERERNGLRDGIKVAFMFLPALAVRDK